MSEQLLHVDEDAVLLARANKAVIEMAQNEKQRADKWTNMYGAAIDEIEQLKSELEAARQSRKRLVRAVRYFMRKAG